MSDESVIAYAKYEWDCPACGDVNTEDHDPSGEEVECESCEATAYVREVM